MRTFICADIWELIRCLRLATEVNREILKFVRSARVHATDLKAACDCVVCLDKPKTYIILNCMHLCLCEDCANSWMKHKGAANTFNKNCPICSKKITQIARIYV